MRISILPITKINLCFPPPVRETIPLMIHQLSTASILFLSLKGLELHLQTLKNSLDFFFFPHFKQNVFSSQKRKLKKCILNYFSPISQIHLLQFRNFSYLLSVTTIYQNLSELIRQPCQVKQPLLLQNNWNYILKKAKYCKLDSSEMST